MKIRNKLTKQVFEVLPGTLYAKNIFEEVTDDDIKVGEPKVEFVIEEHKEKPKRVNKKKANVKKTVKKVNKTKKGAKKNEGNSRK